MLQVNGMLMPDKINNNNMTALSINWGLLWDAAQRIGWAYGLALPTGFLAEREGHAVGIRTFPIVAMASCGYLMVMLGPNESETFTANARVLQGLVAGIGFVGGGAILKTGSRVHGTATAASILNTGAIGAAIALNHLEVGILLSALNLITMLGMVPLKQWLDRSSKPGYKGTSSL
jgi:putative Mg2+ transporter-C (MgtC) family protein